MGEKQLETFASDRLVVSKVPTSQKATLNKIEIWNHTDTGQSKCKVEFSPSLNSACKHRKTMKNCLNMKLTTSLKTCAKMVKMASNYIMAQNLKSLNSLIHQLL